MNNLDTKEIIVSRDDIPIIEIGRRGTNMTKEIIFNFSALVNEFGDGVFTLLYVRPGESDLQPVEDLTIPLVISGNKAVWYVSQHDTEKSGSGVGEIVYRGDHFCYKSNVFTIIVQEDIEDRGKR